MTEHRIIPGVPEIAGPGYIPALYGHLSVLQIEAGDTLRIPTTYPYSEYSFSLNRLLNHYRILYDVKWEGKDNVYYFKSEPKIPKSRDPVTKPWDRTLNANVLDIVRKRRKFKPTGRKCKVYQFERGGEIFNKYPWGEMKAGDYFEIELKSGTTHERERYRKIFNEAAKRHDFELQIQFFYNVKDEEWIPSLRACFVIEGLNALQRAALAHVGKRIPESLKREKLGISADEVRRRRVHFTRWARLIGYTQEEAERIFLDSPLHSRQLASRRERPKITPPARVERPLDTGEISTQPTEALTPPVLESQDNSPPIREIKLDLTDQPGYDRAEIMRQRIARLAQE